MVRSLLSAGVEPPKGYGVGGWLLVGHAEPNLDLFRSFRTVNAPGAILYQKRDVGEPAACSSRRGAR